MGADVQMQPRSRLYAALYGDGDVPTWLSGIVDEIEAAARRDTLAEVADMRTAAEVLDEVWGHVEQHGYDAYAADVRDAVAGVRGALAGLSEPQGTARQPGCHCSEATMAAVGHDWRCPHAGPRP